MLAQYLSYEFIALFMFITMLLMMFTGQRVFGAIGFVAAASALLIWGEGSMEMPYTATWKLFKWYPMLTLPLFILVMLFEPPLTLQKNHNHNFRFLAPTSPHMYPSYAQNGPKVTQKWSKATLIHPK